MLYISSHVLRGEPNRARSFLERTPVTLTGQKRKERGGWRARLKAWKTGHDGGEDYWKRPEMTLTILRMTCNQMRPQKERRQIVTRDSLKLNLTPGSPARLPLATMTLATCVFAMQGATLDCRQGEIGYRRSVLRS